MASEDEDDVDLEALRNAVLATMKKPPKSENSNSNASLNIYQQENSWPDYRQDYTGQNQFQIQTYQQIPRAEINFSNAIQQNWGGFQHGRGRIRGSNNWQTFRRGRGRRVGGAIGGRGSWGGGQDGGGVPGRESGRVPKSNLIVINTLPLKEDSNSSGLPTENVAVDKRVVDVKPVLIRPQDKWHTSDDATTTSASSTPQRRVVNKFSRYENDSDSDEFTDEEIIEEEIIDMPEDNDDNTEIDGEQELEEYEEDQEGSAEIEEEEVEFEGSDIENEIVEEEIIEEYEEDGENIEDAENEQEEVVEEEEEELQEGEEEIVEEEIVEELEEEELPEQEEVVEEKDENECESQENEDSALQKKNDIDIHNNVTNENNSIIVKESSPERQKLDGNLSTSSSPDYTRHGRRRKSSDESDIELDLKSLSSSSVSDDDDVEESATSSGNLSRSNSPASSVKSRSSSQNESRSCSRKNSVDSVSKNTSSEPDRPKSSSIKNKSPDRNASRSNSSNRSEGRVNAKNKRKDSSPTFHKNSVPESKKTVSQKQNHQPKDTSYQSKKDITKLRKKSHSPSRKMFSDVKSDSRKESRCERDASVRKKSENIFSSHKRDNSSTYSSEKNVVHSNTRQEKSYSDTHSLDNNIPKSTQHRRRSRSSSVKNRTLKNSRRSRSRSVSSRSRSRSSSTYARAKNSDKHQGEKGSKTMKKNESTLGSKYDSESKSRNKSKTSDNSVELSNKQTQKMEERRKKFEKEAQIDVKPDKTTISLKGIIPKGKRKSSPKSEKVTASKSKTGKQDKNSSVKNGVNVEKRNKRRKSDSKTAKSSVNENTKNYHIHKPKQKESDSSSDSESSASSVSMLSDSESDSDEDTWRNKKARKTERCKEDIERERKKRLQESRSKSNIVEKDYKRQNDDRLPKKDWKFDTSHGQRRYDGSDQSHFYGRQSNNEKWRPQFVEDDDDDSDSGPGSRKLFSSVVSSSSYSGSRDFPSSTSVKVKVQNDKREKISKSRHYDSLNDHNSYQSYSDVSDDERPVRITFNAGDQRREPKKTNNSEKVSIRDRLGQKNTEKRKYRDIEETDSPPRNKIKRDRKYEDRSEDKYSDKKKSSQHRRKIYSDD